MGGQGDGACANASTGPATAIAAPVGRDGTSGARRGPRLTQAGRIRGPPVLTWRDMRIPTAPRPVYSIEVRAIVEHMCGKSMPQHMRAEFAVRCYLRKVFVNNVVD